MTCSRCGRAPATRESTTLDPDDAYAVTCEACESVVFWRRDRVRFCLTHPSLLQELTRD